MQPSMNIGRRASTSLPATVGATDRRVGQDRSEKGARRDEPPGEERVLLSRDAIDRVGQGVRVGDQLADPLAQHLCVQELLRVLPLVERLGLVQSS